jgi:hypothetical protein
VHWRPITVEGYEDHYEVSDLGRVRRSAPGPGTRPGKIRLPSFSPWGTAMVVLCAPGRTRNVAIAPRVAAAFLPPKPAPGAILKHRDGDRTNCAAANLRWATRRETAGRVGRRPSLSPAQVAEVLALRGVVSGPDAARRYGVSRSTVHRLWRMGSDLAGSPAGRPTPCREARAGESIGGRWGEIVPGPGPQRVRRLVEAAAACGMLDGWARPSR